MDQVAKIAFEAPAQVVFNNNYGEQGQPNASTMMKILGDNAVHAPQ